jgi:hypothetical protein
LEEVNRWIVCACSMAMAMSSTVLAKERTVKALYCWQGVKGDWTLERFKPLINTQTGTVFAEMSFEGAALIEVKLRRFNAASEATFDYKFDSTGKINGLKGSVTVFGEWVAEANMLPDPDGTIPPYHVLYSRDKDRIEKPENAPQFIGRLKEVPVYQTIQAVPCGAMMQEAEKMNATQE